MSAEARTLARIGWRIAGAGGARLIGVGLAVLLGACTAASESAPAPASAEASAPAPAAPSATGPSAASSAGGERAWAAACAGQDGWDQPGPPFRIHGNSWYVGTCGIAAILVAGEDGHVLIDGGTGNAPDLIAANIAALGLRLADVKVLLASHEHFDHVGGLAELQRRSGARLLSSPAAAPVLASGVGAADDPQAGIHEPFDAARVDGLVGGGEPVRLGALSLTPVFTPGHTAGALSWQWQSCEGDDCRTIVYADSLSPISADGYRFSDHPAYLAAYRAGLERLDGLECDILLTPHPSASAVRERIAAGSLTDPAACRRYADSIRQRLATRLAEEAAAR